MIIVPLYRRPHLTIRFYHFGVALVAMSASPYTWSTNVYLQKCCAGTCKLSYREDASHVTA